YRDDVPEEAAGVAGLPHAAGYSRADYGGVPGDLRGAGVREIVREPRSQAADDHGVHAGGGHGGAEIRAVLRGGAGGVHLPFVALEEYWPRRGNDRPSTDG